MGPRGRWSPSSEGPRVCDVMGPERGDRDVTGGPDGHLGAPRGGEDSQGRRGKLSLRSARGVAAVLNRELSDTAFCGVDVGVVKFFHFVLKKCG